MEEQQMRGEVVTTELVQLLFVDAPVQKIQKGVDNSASCNAIEWGRTSGESLRGQGFDLLRYGDGIRV